MRPIFALHACRDPSLRSGKLKNFSIMEPIDGKMRAILTIISRRELRNDGKLGGSIAAKSEFQSVCAAGVLRQPAMNDL
jgi:hypothetical protein